MSEHILHRLRHTFADTGEILDWMDTSDYLGKEAHIHVSGMWEAMRAAANRIEQLQEALQKIVWIATPDYEEARNKATEIARAALREGKDEQ